MYSNSTASNVRNFSWYRQPVDSDTGRVYGDAVKSLPFITTNASWIEQALNSSQGYASFESGWNGAQDPLFLNTVSLHGQGALSLGFSAKALTSFFNNVELYGGSLYLATQSGKVLVGGLPNTQTVIKENSVSLHMTKLNGDPIDHVGNVSCMPNNGKQEDTVLYLGEAKYRVFCSRVEIVGVQSVCIILEKQVFSHELLSGHFPPYFFCGILLCFHLELIKFKPFICGCPFKSFMQDWLID